MTAPRVGARCLACGSLDVAYWGSAHDVEYKTTPEKFTYHRCAACEALSIHPVPADRLREIYPPNYYSFATARRTVVDRVKDALDRRRFHNLLKDVKTASISALDVGGGSGHQLSTLRAADPRVSRTTVVDMDEGAAALAERVGHRFVLGRIEDAKFDEGEKFDVVLLLNLIEHVPDPVAVLKTVRKLLAPGGIALVQTPNYDSLDARLFRERDWGGYHCPRHFVLFTPRSFERTVVGAGLHTRSWRYTQGAPFWTVSALATLERLGAVRVTRERPAWFHPLYPPLAAGFAALDFARGVFMPTSQMTFVLGLPA